MPAKLPTLSKILSLKPEPQTTPTLNQIIQQSEARQTVSDYLFTPSLRVHAKRVFECVVHGKGQGFWAQAEYGAGKTSLLGTILCLLMWGKEDGVWDALRDSELRDEYQHALEKRKLFPIAFSMKGLGDSRGASHDSLMQIFEEQIEESVRSLRPDLVGKVRFTSSDLALDWFDTEAPSHVKVGVEHYIKEKHQMSSTEYRKAYGEKKLGQVISDSNMVGAHLKSKFKERFRHICLQITKLGGYDGVIFVVDEFRSWQDRHAQHSAVAAEDEDVLETLAHVLPGEGINVITIIASQGDIPQKLSGGGKSDRFVPLILLGDKSKSDFGEIVAFRTVEHLKGAVTGIKDYYDGCRKEYRFLKQANISQEAFSAIFPFQPRVFEILRRITQSAEQNNLPTARSAIRMAWQAISDGNLLAENRLVVVSDLIRSEEMTKGLTSDLYKEKYKSLTASIEQLDELGLAPEEKDQARRILETLFLQAISLPDNLRDGLTEQEIAEAAWLADDALGSAGQANHLLDILINGGSPVRREKKQRGGTEVTVYSYETSALELKPASVFAPLKKKFKDDAVAQDAKWIESLFWDIQVITPEIQAELQINGGLLNEFQPDDQRTHEDIKSGAPARYALPKTIAATTKRVHNIAYGGEAIAGTNWRDEWGKAIDKPDIHFRVVFLTGDWGAKDDAIQGSIADPRIAVCRTKALSTDTREALADLLAAEKMRRDNATSAALRSYAEEKRADAIKTILRQQLLEYKGGKILTQANYGIQPIEVFASANKTDDIARRLLEKAYDKPLFIPQDIKKPFSETEARKVYSGLFGKEPEKASRDAATNYAPGLELSKKSAPQELRADDSSALKKIRDLLKGKTDVPVKDLKAAFCTPPHGLTDWMVQLYVFTLLKLGGWELVLNPSSPVQTNDGKSLPGNRLTAHTLAIVDWNAKLDKGLLGARLSASTAKGWNEVLEFARVLDPSLKTAATPDEEQERNDSLVKLLKSLAAELPQVESTLQQVAPALDGEIGEPLKVLLARLTTISATSEFHEFDAVVRENYDSPEKFSAAYEDYKKALLIRDVGVDLMGAAAYLRAACNIDPAIDTDRNALLSFLKFDTLLTGPHVIGARLETFKKWKARYAQAYRKAHHAHYEELEKIGKQVKALASKVRGLVRLNSITELGPILPSTATVAADLSVLEKAVWVCPDAAEAAVEAGNAICQKCDWTPETALPDAAPLANRVQAGIADRMQRFKDAAITSILQKSDKPEIKTLLDVIAVANSDKLLDLLTDELIAFIRKLLQEQNLAQVEVTLDDILDELGAIEGERIDEAVDQFAVRLRKKLKDAKANQEAGKRVRLFIRGGGQ